MSIVKLRLFTPGIARHIFAVPALSAHHVRTDGHPVAHLQHISVIGQIPGALLVDVHDLHDQLVPLDDGEGD